MSKELEALERGIIEFEKELEDDCNNEWLKRVVAGMKECYARLKAIENAKPSEALEYVDMLKEDGCITTLYQGKALETIRQALLKAQEQENKIKILEYKNNLLKKNAEYVEIISEQYKLLSEIKEKVELLKECLK